MGEGFLIVHLEVSLYYLPIGPVIKTDLKMNFEEALTHALHDLRDNWESYRDIFLKR